MINIKTYALKISLILLATTMIMAKHYKESKRFTILEYRGRDARYFHESVGDVVNKKLTPEQYNTILSSLNDSFLVSGVTKSTVISYSLFDIKRHGFWINIFLLFSIIGIIILFVPANNRLSLFLVVASLLLIGYFQKEETSNTNNPLSSLRSKITQIESEVSDLSDEITNLKSEIDDMRYR